MFKLLVIDDEDNIRYGIEQVFDGADVQVFGAPSAEHGLRLADEQSPDVILLDIRLGARDGLDVFHDLRKIDPKSLIIFITGQGTSDTAIEAMKRGAHDYLVKPLDAGQLKKVVGQAFQISRLMHVPAFVEKGGRPEHSPDHSRRRQPHSAVVA
jgi:two-component system nitrogen regulation response regulator GlnG